MLENAKRKVVEIARLAEKEKMCLPKSGNFSLRDRKTGYILITPSGIKRDDLTEDSIIVLDMQGNIIENKAGFKPSTETAMHLKAYETRQDVASVCHTHAFYATIFSVLSKEIEPVVLEAVFYGVKVPLARYGRPGTKDLAESIVEPLSISDACLLERHGVLTVGKDLDDAFLKMQYVEEVAKMYYYVLLQKNDITAIPREELEAIAHS